LKADKCNQQRKQQKLLLIQPKNNLHKNARGTGKESSSFFPKLLLQDAQKSEDFIQKPTRSTDTTKEKPL